MAVGFVGRDVAAQNQLLGVDLGQRRPILDLLVHERLGERRLVPFVVAMTAVAVHVDDDVAVERLAEIDRQLGNKGSRLGIFAVHVEDRHLDHLGDVGAISRRAGVAAAPS